MKYELYINDLLCDLDDSSLIVLNYTMEQLNSPTAVKNTYSHEVELPSTERNDKVFSYFYRNDYVVGRANFSPLQQIPFAIYNELGEIAERGYIKLDEVQVDKVAHTYKVVLYGGLGSFFYAMGYTDNGDALKLGDLQYMQNSEDEGLLNFPITANFVRDAWLYPNSEPYSVINFAPMYNGKPSGDFDPQTAIYLGEKGTGNEIDLPIYGLPSLDISQMTPTNLYAINGATRVWAKKIKLNRQFTEWETKDLRAYLQRPILSVRKFVEAVQRRATSYGYTLNLDSNFFNENNPYYNDAWLTLPSLQSLKTTGKDGQALLSGNMPISSTSSESSISIPFSLPDTEGYEFGADFKDITINIPEIAIAISQANAENVNKYVSLSATKIEIDEGRPITTLIRVAWFIQAIALDKDGELCGVSNIAVIKNSADTDIENVVSNAGYIPYQSGTAIEYSSINDIFNLTAETTTSGDLICRNFANITLTIPNANNANSIIIKTTKKTYKSASDSTSVFSDKRGHSTSVIVMKYEFPYDGVPNTVAGTADVSANQSISSGTIVQKSKLFDIGKTPLEVLLSYCKQFGLVWLYDNGSNAINLMQRTTFYNGGTAEDWSNRIDHNRDITIKPFEFDKRFYDFELETQGEWAEAYKEKYGKVYGSQRVNTGYNFDQDSKNLLQDNALKGGTEVLEQSKYFNNITEDGLICPSVFLEGGEYTIINEEGEEETAQVLPPTASATIEYMNALQGYDYMPKLQMHNADNAPIESGLTLLLYKGTIYTQSTPYERFRLTDDIPEMGLLNEGKLCWILEGGYFTQTYGALDIPHFVRANGVSLDMGVPQELDNPDADTEAVQKSIYSQYWQKYLGDRYDQNSRVLTCYVDLRGVQVSNALFRNFYYFDNAVWVLNKITNYSMTTAGTTQCEFVKVQDINNYKG